MSIWETNGGVYFGFGADDLEGGNVDYRKPLRYADDRHLITIGPNGSGKSRRLLLPNLVELTGWSMLVIDPKGELCAMTAAHRKKHGNEILILNPFNSVGLGSTGFDPIKTLKVTDGPAGPWSKQYDDFPDDALWLAESMIRVEGKEPHWSQSAQEWVAALIMYTRLVLNGTFADVRALLALDDNRMGRLVLGGSNLDPEIYDRWQQAKRGGNEAMEAFRDEHPGYNRPPFAYKRPGEPEKLYPGMLDAAEDLGWDEMDRKGSRFGDITPEDREIHSVISTALTQTRWLDSRPVKRDLGGPAFDFAVMKQRPVTVYLILPANRLGTHSTWLRLMIASVMQALMKDVGKSKVPILLMLDEFYGIAEGDGLPVITRNMAMMRGYGIKLWTILQDLGQAERLFGPQGFESFMSNAGVLQSYAPQDVLTAKYLSERTGQTSRMIQSGGRSINRQPGQPVGFSTTDSLNVNQIQMPLLLPQDIRNMDPGYSLYLSHHYKGPVRHFMPWPDQLPHMRSIMALDPA